MLAQSTLTYKHTDDATYAHTRNNSQITDLTSASRSLDDECRGCEAFGCGGGLLLYSSSVENTRTRDSASRKARPFISRQVSNSRGSEW